MREIKIGILIPVHNGLDFTTKCLKGLYERIAEKTFLQAEFHIIVIDDGSNDGTSEWIKSNYPQTIVLEGDGNLWWSGGINEGTRFAVEEINCNYLLWWNNDITPSHDYFKNLEDILVNDSPEVAGSKIYYAHDPQMIWSMGGIFDSGNGKKFMTGMNQKDSEEYITVHKADWLPGMGTILHRSVIDKIGLLDAKNFPQYHGDSDFTLRAKLSMFIRN
jgi:GT2 family glycosyltransferase